jgi:hypothetical protein
MTELNRIFSSSLKIILNELIDMEIMSIKVLLTKVIFDHFELSIHKLFLMTSLYTFGLTR